MAVIDLDQILARAHTIATQMATDANMSPVIDDRAGMYALLPSVIQTVYRQKAVDQKFLADITKKSTVVITGGKRFRISPSIYIWYKVFTIVASDCRANTSDLPAIHLSLIGR